MEKEIRRHFSKIGFAYLAGSIVIYAVQFLAAMVGKKFVPGVMADANGSFILLMLTMYGISMPCDQEQNPHWRLLQRQQVII